MNTYRIAIYSGAVPSTEFIERLIIGLASSDLEIHLFGSISNRVPSYSKSVKLHLNKRGWMGMLQFIFRMVKLSFKFPNFFEILHSELKSCPWNNSESFALWRRHVPILLNLPDIFHVQWTKNSEEFLYLKRYFGVKLVVSLRGTHINISPICNQNLKLTYNKVFPQVDAFHAVSNAISTESQKYFACPSKIKVIYTGLPELNNNLEFLNDQIKLKESTVKLICVGRFHWIKGYIYVLDALNILRYKNISAQLTIVAPGNMSEEELFLIHDLKLQDNIVHIKGLTFTEVQKLMSKQHALILPSIEEGIANVVLEAMQIGLPVISSDCGGMSEVITNKLNGLLVPVRNAASIADAVEYLIQMGPCDKDALIQNARDTIHQKFNINNALSEFEELYSNTMKKF